MMKVLRIGLLLVITTVITSELLSWAGELMSQPSNLHLLLGLLLGVGVVVWWILMVSLVVLEFRGKKEPPEDEHE